MNDLSVAVRGLAMHLMELHGHEDKMTRVRGNIASAYLQSCGHNPDTELFMNVAAIMEGRAAAHEQAKILLDKIHFVEESGATIKLTEGKSS